MSGATFKSPFGPYALHYDQCANAVVVVEIESQRLTWHVDVTDEPIVQGMTRGLKEHWGEEYWFRLDTRAPMSISYFGNQALVRTDHEVLN